MRPVVLVLIKGLGIGGAERLIAEGSAAWDRDAFDYRVAYVVPWKDQLVGDLTSAGVPVSCIGGSRGMGLSTPVALRRLVRQWDPAVVHTHSPSVAVVARTVVARPHVYTEHNLAGSYRQPTRTLNRLTYARNRSVTAVSQAVADSLVGFPGPEPIVVPNGVAPKVSAEEVASVRSELLHDGPLVVHVGNIRPLKGHGHLIAAAAHLRKAIPGILVVSIGVEKHPGDLDRLRGAAEAAGVAETIRFLGRRSDARAFLAAADVVVNPSDVEGLPLTVLEALALGRPVVATAVGGVPTVVLPGETGLLVEPGDPEALALAVVEALGAPEKEAWGKAGAELVASHHGIAPMIRAFEDLYRAAIA